MSKYNPCVASCCSILFLETMSPVEIQTLKHLGLIDPNMKAPRPAISPNNLRLITLSAPARKIRRAFQKCLYFYFVFY